MVKQSVHNYPNIFLQNFQLILEWALPLGTFWKSWFGKKGGYIKPGNRQSGEFWWGAPGGSTGGQFRSIVVNKSVVKPLCDQLLSGDEGERGGLGLQRGTGIWCHNRFMFLCI